MDILNSLLTLEAGASVLVAGALAIVVRSFNLYSKEASDLQPKLKRVTKELNRLREQIEPKKKLISQLNKEIVPLREKEKEFDDFFQTLRQVELEEKKEVADEQEKNSADERRKLQRRRMGFGGSDDS